MSGTSTQDERQYAGFIGQRKVATGGLLKVVLKLKAKVDGGDKGSVTLIDDSTGDSVDVSLHGTPEQLRARLEKRLLEQGSEEAEPSPRTGPGRPKLGVVSREVSLLPRHWAWLNEQSGGASAALRRLVEQGKREGAAKDLARRARDAAYRFLYVMGGDLPGFEEASRALFAADLERLTQLLEPWPRDLREHAHLLIDRWQEREREADAPVR